MRQQVKVNPWALLRPACWLVGHRWIDVYPGDAFSGFYELCMRCLEEKEGA